MEHFDSLFFKKSILVIRSLILLFRNTVYTGDRLQAAILLEQEYVLLPLLVIFYIVHYITYNIGRVFISPLDVKFILKYI